MNQNAEVVGILLAPLAALADIRWWHIALALVLLITVIGFAIFGVVSLFR